MKKIALHTLLVVISVFTGFAILEGISRWLENPGESQAVLHNDMENFFAFDPVLGWTNAANKDGELFGNRHTHIHINSDGMRYREVGPKQRFRVGVIGDSYTSGLGVEANERFTELVEQELPIDMLNFGVVGYGLVQYYLELDHVLKFKPDVVLIVFCLCNDFQNTVTTQRQPYAALENGRLVIKGVPVKNKALVKDALRPWISYSALARRLYVYFNKNQQQWDDFIFKSDASEFNVKGLRMDSFYKDPDGRPAQEDFAVTEAVMRAIKNRLDAEHIPMLILQARSTNDLGNDVVSNKLKVIAADLRVPLIDPADTSPRDHLDHLGHWSVRGNKTVAHALIPALLPYVTHNEGH